MSPSGAPELACVPSAIPGAARHAHFALAHELLEIQAEERVSLPNGYAFRFRPETLRAVADFVANERKCCPFLAFALELGPDSGPLWLRMTGPVGTRELLDAELNLKVSKPGCNCK